MPASQFPAAIAKGRASPHNRGYASEAIKVRTQLDRVLQVQRTLNEQIEAIRGSLLLSRILREQRGSLPAIDAHDGLQEVIADVEATPALLDSLSRLYQSRRELIDELEQEYGDLLTTAVDLQLNQQQLLSISRSLRATIFELRIFVNDLLDRLYAADEINRRLDVEFREHGIRIAFNQMDVWLHNSDGQVARVVSKPAGRPLGDGSASARPGTRGECDAGDGDN